LTAVSGSRGHVASGRRDSKLEVVEQPAADDVIVEQAGVSLFLDEEAAGYLADKTLDVEPTIYDEVEFVVSQNGRPLIDA
jgi:Fe-S cluster assembly iron-binding protein IscA